MNSKWFNNSLIAILVCFTISSSIAEEPAIVIKPPHLNGRLEGSVRILEGRSLNINGGAEILGDILIPGDPRVNVNGSPNFAGVLVGSGSSHPSGYSLNINSGVKLGHVITRSDPITLPIVKRPNLYTGVKHVSLNKGQIVDDWSKLRSLNLNSNYGNIVVPPGNYDRFVLNSNSSMTLGVAGAVEPSVYNLTQLTLNNNSQVILAGPVLLNSKSGVMVNSQSILGLSQPENDFPLELNVYSGNVTINSGGLLNAKLLAPKSRVNINGTLCSWVGSKYLTLNSGGLLRLKEFGVSDAVNLAPEAQNSSVSVIEDTDVPLLLQAIDPEGDVLNYTVINEPLNGVVERVDGVLTYQPLPDFHGIDQITFIANDGVNDSNPANVTITVTPVNDAPTAGDIAQMLEEDTTIELTLTGRDVDEDVLSYEIFTQPKQGVLTGDAPNLTYEPQGDFYGVDKFTYRVNDGEAPSNTATVEITVKPVNDPPVASILELSTKEDIPKGIVLTGRDVDGDTLSFKVKTEPTNGVLSGIAPDLTYTPDPNFHGNDSFTFEVNDGKVDSEPRVVAVLVVNENDAPVARKVEYTTREEIVVIRQLVASDPDGDNLVFNLLHSPEYGTARVSSSGELQYTPEQDFFGKDTLVVRVSDGKGGEVALEVSVNVTAVNDPPIGVSQLLIVNEDESVNVTLQATDVEGDPLSYKVLEGLDPGLGEAYGPIHGVIQGVAPNLVYTPLENFSGKDRITFIANDAEGESFSTVIEFDVLPVNDTPVANDLFEEITSNEPLEGVLKATDVDQDELEYLVHTPAQNGQVVLGEAGAFSYIPNRDFYGDDFFLYQVNDGEEKSAPGRVSIIVVQGNESPISLPGTVTVNEDEVIVFGLNGRDPEGAELTYRVTSDPKNGIIEQLVDGQIHIRINLRCKSFKINELNCN